MAVHGAGPLGCADDLGKSKYEWLDGNQSHRIRGVLGIGQPVMLFILGYRILTTSSTHFGVEFMGS